MQVIKSFLKFLFFCVEPIILIVLIPIAIFARFVPKKFDFGIGPLPLINNIYHKQVLVNLGYSVETYVIQVWHITQDFDVRHDENILARIPLLGTQLICILAFCRAIYKYRCWLIYFNGGPLSFVNGGLLWRCEPFLIKLANVKSMVLAYGADVQVMSRSPNLLFKDAMSKDYPIHRKRHKRIAEQIDLWSREGTHIFGGCEWVDYMTHWDTLMISHFSIDMEKWIADKSIRSGYDADVFRIFHAPNHRAIKGTANVVQAVEELKDEGLNVELVLVEKKSNEEIRHLIQSSDLIVDQLVIGWYAMFAIEAMALEKPVICHLRKDLEELYRNAGLYSPDEKIPMIDATPMTIKMVIRDLYHKRDELAEIGRRGRDYVVKHHSIDAIGRSFDAVVKSILQR